MLVANCVWYQLHMTESYLVMLSLLEQGAAAPLGPNDDVIIKSLWCHLPPQTWRDPQGVASQLSPWNSNVTDCKNCFLTAGETVRKCCMVFKRGKEGNKKKNIPKFNNSPLEHIHLPKPQTVRQVQVRRHQGNMKKKKKRRNKLVQR